MTAPLIILIGVVSVDPIEPTVEEVLPEMESNSLVALIILEEPFTCCEKENIKKDITFADIFWDDEEK